MSNRIHLLIVAALMAAPGCSQPGPTGTVLETAPVSGTLTYQGQPLSSFLVVFTPVDGRRPATGRTDSAGRFQLGTNAPGDGAVVGAHKISVAFDPDTGVDSTQAMPIEDPAEMPKPPVEIPAKYANPETSGLTQDVPASGVTDLKIDLLPDSGAG